MLRYDYSPLPMRLKKEQRTRRLKKRFKRMSVLSISIITVFAIQAFVLHFRA